MSEQANKQANFPKCTVEFIALNHIGMCRVSRRQAHKRLSYNALSFHLHPLASAAHIVVIWSTSYHSFSLLAFSSSSLPKCDQEWEWRRWWQEIPMFNMHNRHTKLCLPSYKTTIIPRKKHSNKQKHFPSSSSGVLHPWKAPYLHLSWCLHLCRQNGTVTCYTICVRVVVFCAYVCLCLRGVWETQQKRSTPHNFHLMSIWNTHLEIYSTQNVWVGCGCSPGVCNMHFKTSCTYTRYTISLSQLTLSCLEQTSTIYILKDTTTAAAALFFFGIWIAFTEN